MSTPLPLDLLLGPHQAAAVVKRIAAAIADQDQFPPALALRLACERATDGDPLVIAAPGQVWSLRDDVDPDDAPARRLAVHLRLTCPPRVHVCDADEPNEIDELLIEVLDLYQLDSWDIRFLNSPTAAS